MDGDAALAQRIHEHVVLLPCAFDPQDVIEQQIMAIVWGKAAKAEIGTMHDDLAQTADF
ncbi:MAG: hypothetical protein QM767_03005 [Anaeromyxobacter sp.]